jgi:hypothetical protein
VATALGGETVQSLNRTMAEKLNAARPAQHANSIVPLLEAILTRLAIRGERGDAPEVTRGETVKALGYTRYPVEIATEPGVHISAQIMMPTTGQKKKPALLYLEKGAKFESGAWETLVRAGYVVMIPQPRGWDIPPKARRGGYGEEWQTAMRALLVGKTLIGMQVHDVLRAYDYLRTRQEVDTRRIGIRSVGNASAVAMYAAALESGIRGVRCAGPLPSYLGIARAKEPENVISLIAPGVLRDFDLPDLARILGVADQCRE